MKKYPGEMRERVLERIRAGERQRSLGAEYGISRWAIQSWIKGNGIPENQEIHRNPKTVLRIMKKYNALAEIRRCRKWVQMGHRYFLHSHGSGCPLSVYNPRPL